ncbi:hypothetical protein G7076_11195 [Sphingomonas sp. HDW15A]|uniref:hypothetical protein n=1 Tax=Sphingomonas sp. HDW15A TaxID=2714942 RepID=UPI0014088BCC|nr:hypothetical protein [Sphingomonas sp. HDW15A]QIK96912.1 hypothetical protein G7076_11195 [Sphingomonas sp. HDW15A]
MKALNLALAAALLTTGAAATAQSPSDVQCIVVSNAYAGQAKDANAQKIAEAAIFFYLGRVGNTMTSAQLKAMLDAQTKTLNQQNAGPTMQKCAAAVQAKVELLQGAAPAPVKPAAAKPSPQGR